MCKVDSFYSTPDEQRLSTDLRETHGDVLRLQDQVKRMAERIDDLKRERAKLTNELAHAKRERVEQQQRADAAERERDRLISTAAELLCKLEDRRLRLKRAERTEKAFGSASRLYENERARAERLQRRWRLLLEHWRDTKAQWQSDSGFALALCQALGFDDDSDPIAVLRAAHDLRARAGRLAEEVRGLPRFALQLCSGDGSPCAAVMDEDELGDYLDRGDALAALADAPISGREEDGASCGPRGQRFAPKEDE